MSTDLMETMLRQRDAEIAGLRAENDRLRAEVAALRGFAQSLNHRDWARQAMFNHGLLDTAGQPTALLTGERRDE